MSMRPSLRSWRWSLVVAFAVLPLSGDQSVRVDSHRSSPSLPLWLVGCAALTREDVCELDAEREISVLSRQPLAIATRSATPAPRLGPAVESAGLYRHELAVGDAVVEVELSSASGRSRVRFADSTYPRELAALQALRTPATLAALEHRIDLLAARYSHPLDQARLSVWRAKLAFSRGQPEVAARHNRAAIPVLRAAGRDSEALSASFALAFGLFEQLERYDQARSVLQASRALLGRDALAHAKHSYYQAVLAMRTAQPMRGLTLLAEAKRLARSAGQHSLLGQALQIEAVIESQLGRFRAAQVTLEAAAQLAASPCDRVALEVNLAVLSEREAQARGEASPGDASGLRARLLETKRAEAAQCENATLAALLDHHLAALDLLAGRFERARERIAQARARAGEHDQRFAAFELELRGRLALERGEFGEALRIYDELGARLDYAGQARPDAELGRARALIGLGRRRDAIVTLERADERVGELMRALPLEVGASAGEGRAAVTRLLIEQLLRERNAALAFAYQRRARMRRLGGLAWLAVDGQLEPEARERREQALGEYARRRERLALDQRAAWSLPLAQLDRERARRRAELDALYQLVAGVLPQLAFPLPKDPPQPGVLLLGYFARDGAIDAFAQTGGDVQYARIAADRSGDVADTSAWLAPFSARLEAAERVRIVGDEALPDAPHTLPYRGRPLLASLPIEYALDPPTATRPSPPAGSQLFVTDPRLDLPGAREEGAALRQRFPGARHLDGRRATLAAVRAALGSTDQLHFAGHARIEPDAFWQSALLLADDEALTVADILAARSVPTRAVLLACESGRSPVQASAALGIGEAFIARGAAEVLAAETRLSDASAQIFSRLFYSAKGGLAQRARTAQLGLLAAGHDWRAYRVLVR